MATIPLAATEKLVENVPLVIDTVPLLARSEVIHTVIRPSVLDCI